MDVELRELRRFWTNCVLNEKSIRFSRTNPMITHTEYFVLISDKLTPIGLFVPCPVTFN